MHDTESRDNVTPWWSTPFTMFQTNLREIDATMDVEAVLRRIIDLGANTWLINVGGIVSFFPSELPYAHVSPWLAGRATGDLIADVTKAACRSRVRVVGRLDFSKVHSDVATEHPEWCFRTEENEPQIYNDLYSMCPSGEYYQSKSIEILDEIINRYELDGFFFNWFSFNYRDYSGKVHGVCHCENCARRFRAFYGSSLPRRNDQDVHKLVAWRSFCKETLDELANNIRKFIRGRSANIGLILRNNTDVAFKEVNNAVDRALPFWPYEAGESCREVRYSAPGRQLLVNSVMFLDIPYRYAPEQPGLMFTHLAQTIAHGGVPSAYMVGTPPVFGEDEIFSVVRDMLSFRRENYALYRDLRSAARVVLVRGASGDAEEGRKDLEKESVSEYRGIFSALIAEHIPFDVISEEALSSVDVDNFGDLYDVVVIAGSAHLSEGARHVVDTYVEQGGGCIVTYPTAGEGEAGAVGLESLGVDRVSEAPKRARGWVRGDYLRIDDVAMNGLTGSELIPLDGDFLLSHTRSGARESLRLVESPRYGPPEKCYGEYDSEYAGVITYDYGRGKTMYLPWPIGALYYKLRLPVYRGLLRKLIEQTSGEGLQIKTSMSEQVEVVVSRRITDGAIVVHLINYSGHNGRSFGSAIEMKDVTFSLRSNRAWRTAKTLVHDVGVTLEQDGQWTKVRVSSLGGFEAICLTAEE